MALDSAAKRQAVPGAGRPWLRSQMRDTDKGEEWRISAGNAYPVASLSAAAPAAQVAASVEDGGGGLGWNDAIRINRERREKYLAEDEEVMAIIQQAMKTIVKYYY